MPYSLEQLRAVEAGSQPAPAKKKGYSLADLKALDAAPPAQPDEDLRLAESDQMPSTLNPAAPEGSGMAGDYSILEVPERLRRAIADTPLPGVEPPILKAGRVILGGVAKLAAGLPLAGPQVIASAEQNMREGQGAGEAISRALVDTGLSLTGVPTIVQHGRTLAGLLPEAIQPDWAAGPLEREEVGREILKDPVAAVVPYAMAAGIASGAIRGVRAGLEPRPMNANQQTLANLADYMSKDVGEQVIARNLPGPSEVAPEAARPWPDMAGLDRALGQFPEAVKVTPKAPGYTLEALKAEEAKAGGPPTKAERILGTERRGPGRMNITFDRDFTPEGHEAFAQGLLKKNATSRLSEPGYNIEKARGDADVLYRDQVWKDARAVTAEAVKEAGGTAREAANFTGGQTLELRRLQGQERAARTTTILNEMRGRGAAASAGQEPITQTTTKQMPTLTIPEKEAPPLTETAAFGEQGAARFRLEKEIYADLTKRKIGGKMALMNRAEVVQRIAADMERKGVTDYKEYRRLADEDLEGGVPSFVREAEQVPPEGMEAGAMGRPVRPSADQGILSPSGKVSERSREAALERTRQGLFGKEGLQKEPVFQPTEMKADLRRAGELRDLAARGMGPRKNLQEAERLEMKWRKEPATLGSPMRPETPSTALPGRQVAPSSAGGPRLNPHDVRRFLEEKLTVPIRRRMFQGQGRTHLGVFKVKPEVIRAFKSDDLPTIAHEVGHKLDREMGLRQGTTPAMRRELFDAGKRLYGNRIPTGGYKSEGVAEFHSFLLTDPARAAKEFPAYHAEYTKRLEAHPEIKAVLDEARDMVTRLEGQSALEEVRGRIRSRSEIKKPGGGQEFIRKWYDDLIPAHNFDKAVKSLDPARASRLYDRAYQARNWSATAEEILRHHMIDSKGKTVGPSLMEILKPVRDRIGEDLDPYLVAQVTKVRNPMGKTTGISTDIATQAVRELQAQDPKAFQAVQKAAQGLQTLQDQMLALAVDEGIVTAEGAQAMRETHGFYAPMHRLIEESGTSEGGLGGLYQRAKGGEQEILRPTENIVKNVHALAYRIGQQRVGAELLKAAREVQGVGRYVEEVPMPMEARDVTVREALDAIRKSSPETAKALEALPEKALEGVITAFRPSTAAAQRKGLFVVMDKGKPVALQIGDPVLRDTLLGLNREQIADWSQKVGRITSLLRLGATAANPEFAPINFIRDQATAFLNSDYGFIPLVSTIRSIPDMARNSPLWKEYRLSGAQQAQLLEIDRLYLEGGISDALAGKRIPAKRGIVGKAQAATRSVVPVIKSPFTATVRVNQAIENLTRFSEYRLAKAKTGDPLTAMRAAQEITVNFQRVGANARALSLMAPFYKANVNALGRIGGTAVAHPARTALRVTAGIALPAALLYAANADDPEYQAINQRVRDLYFLIKIGPGKWIRLPKPDLPGVLVGAGTEHALDWFRKKDPQGFAEWAANTIKSNAPGVAGFPVPSPLLTAIEQATNYSLFWDAPIVPEYKKGLIPELQARPMTGPTARRLARVTGWPAAKIEHGIGGMFGGVGTMALRAADVAGMATGVLEKPTPKAGLAAPSSTSRIPILRRFVQELPPEEYRSALTEQQWKTKTDGESLLASWRELLKTGSESDRSAFQRTYGAKLQAYLKQKQELDRLYKEGKPKQRPIRLQDARRALENR